MLFRRLPVRSHYFHTRYLPKKHRISEKQDYAFVELRPPTIIPTEIIIILYGDNTNPLWPVSSVSVKLSPLFSISSWLPRTLFWRTRHFMHGITFHFIIYLVSPPFSYRSHASGIGPGYLRPHCWQQMTNYYHACAWELVLFGPTFAEAAVTSLCNTIIDRAVYGWWERSRRLSWVQLSVIKGVFENKTDTPISSHG